MYTEAAVPRSPTQVSMDAPSPLDPRFPRAAPLRQLRGACVMWWVLFSAYPMIVVPKLYQLVAYGSPREILSWPDVAQALLLDHLWPLLLQHPLPAITVLLGCATLFALGHWANGDLEQERAELRRRREREEYEALRRLMMGVVAQTHAGCARCQHGELDPSPSPH